ncbi:5250_t:CDS:10 [Diversispora eburnea]|uniref:5250_t:CDS:1 n=1 Tax=Diversispora eburnea TaxID=1213867 RepID=A0A9N8ZEY9_9GLOM|nr:5250_t:CDS:10 [Diversispora eburnea]
MTDITFEITNKNFVEWFCSNGGILSSKIAFKDYSFENAGRGIVALEDIEEFNNLYKINQWFPLIICLMYESQSKDSLWKPYFDILPTEFNTPMFWNEDELEELIGTEKIGRDDTENSFNEYLLPFIQARLFREKGLSQMIATKKINKGEQIYNTYGDLCSSDLLRKYGFVDENNIHDIVEINGQFVVDNLSVEETNKKEKVELLLEEDILDDVFILDTSNNLPPDLIITVKVMMMNKVQFKVLKEMGKFPKPKMIPELKNPLIELLKKRLFEYRTSINSDEEILMNKNNISKKLKNAIMVRLSEKKILQNVIDFLVSWEPENVIDKKRSNKRIKVE